jgi:hypothetical protein
MPQQVRSGRHANIGALVYQESAQSVPSEVSHGAQLSKRPDVPLSVLVPRLVVASPNRICLLRDLFSELSD